MVSSTTLDQVAVDGLGAAPEHQLRDLADWCWDWGVATGDARYSGLWRILNDVFDWLESQHGQVATSDYNRVSGMLQRAIPKILAASTAASGAQFAAQLATELSTAVGR